MIAKLARYGGANSTIEMVDGAAFGASLHATVPEDDSDRQPLLKGERWLFVADARIDNREDLERALGLRPQLGDSEILFEALIRWDVSALDRVVGDFAFALFDAKERTLLLARDPTGQRPLFYASGKDFAAFASMASGLAGGRGIGTDLNREAIARALSDIPPEPGSSYFQSIRKVQPGSWVRIERFAATTANYWNPSHAPCDWIEQPEPVEAYHSLLDATVRPRLRRSNGPIAVQLSSGLDSSAVAMAAARLSGATKIVALTSAPPLSLDVESPRGRFPDESRLAAEVASRLGIRHSIIRETGSAIAHLREHASLYQEPYRNNINAGWLSRLALAARAEGCAVMLTGDVGNLTLNAGSIANLGDLIASGAWMRWLREARLARRLGGARWTGVMMNSFGHRLPRWAVDRLERRFLGTAPRADSTFLCSEAVETFVRPMLPLRTETRSGDSYADRLAVLRSYDFGNFNKGTLAECGVDLRHPLLDRRAVEFSLRLPPWELFSGGRSRALARRSLAGRVPDMILAMTERGYQGAGWHQRVGSDELLSIVEEIEASPTARSLLDLGRLRRTCEKWDRLDIDDPAENLRVNTFLSLALAGGLFMREAERGFPALG